MISGSDTPSILIVDDEPDVAEVYAIRLGPDYETRVATGGPEALESISPQIDIVLLDRRMPKLSGEEVLAEIRERGYPCRIIMITAVDPGLDIVDMQFDDYLCKPVQKTDLVEAIEQQLAIERRDDSVAAYLEARTKLELLESTVGIARSRDVPELERLEARVRDLRSEIESSEIDIEHIDQSFSTISRRPD